jgi:hypothetical protein
MKKLPADHMLEKSRKYIVLYLLKKELQRTYTVFYLFHIYMYTIGQVSSSR